MRTSIAAMLLLSGVAYAEEPVAPAEPPKQEEVKQEPVAKKETAAIEPLSTTDTVSVSKDPPPQTDKGVELGDVRFELHGYARMPLAAQTTPRAPFLVDNDYYLSGFAYTRLYEPDWSELFFSARRGNYKAEFG
ncbi:MAG TPA: hypothetical protein VIV11_21495, partial [Kofleriaceae bacterium]